jgi:hypothetical protein
VGGDATVASVPNVVARTPTPSQVNRMVTS